MQATQASFNPAIESEAGYGQIFAILLRRRFWVLGVLVAAIGVAALQTMRQAPTYVSSMQLLIESNYQGKPSGNNGLENEFSDANVQADTGTQINLMQSSELLRRAMVLLQQDYPDINPDDPSSVAGFKGSINISQITQKTGKENVATKIFQIVHTGNDPVETQKVLEALKKVYLDYNLEQQKKRLVKGLAFVNEQLPQVKNKMQQAESALKQFRQNQELIDPDLQAKVQTEGLLRVEQEQQTNQVQLRELRSRYASLQQQLALSPPDAIALSRLSQSGRYQNLLNEIQKTDLSLEQQRLRFKDQTPFVQQLKNQRQRQLALLQAQVQRVFGSGSALTSGSEEQLLQGQFGSLDQTLVGQLVDTQIGLQVAEAREASLATIQQRLRSELKRFPELLAEYGRLQPEVQLSQETLKQLLKAQQDIGLEIARGGFDWQVVEDPQMGAKTGPSMMRNLMLGAVAGLMLGGAAAFARESADDAVHSSDDLQKQVPVPLLGMVPELLFDATGDDMPLLSLPFSKSRSLSPGIDRVIQWQPFRESLDLLYQNIQLLSREQPFKSLVITSALAGEGKSTIILGLAISAARLHQRVLLIDADLRRPSLHKLLNLPNDRGLSNLLTSDTPIPQQVDAQHSNLRSNISVVTAGPTPIDPAKLLSSQRMREVMATFEQNYDLVLLDAPPVLGMVDSMLVGACCNGVIIVGRIERVTRSELTQTTQMLSQLNVIGVVANGASHQTRNDRHYQR